MVHYFDRSLSPADAGGRAISAGLIKPASCNWCMSRKRFFVSQSCTRRDCYAAIQFSCIESVRTVTPGPTAAQDCIPIVDNDAHLQPSASAFPEEHLTLVKPRKQAGTDNETEAKNRRRDAQEHGSRDENEIRCAVFACRCACPRVHEQRSCGARKL